MTAPGTTTISGARAPALPPAVLRRRGRTGRPPAGSGRVRRRAADAAAHLALLLLASVTLAPVAWMVAAAFKHRGDILPADGRLASLFVPPGDGAFGRAWDRFTLENFRALFERLDLGTALVNSVFFAGASAILTTLVAAAAGYALARVRFAGRGLVFGLVVAGLIVPGPLLLAPTFALLDTLGMLNSYAGLIAPGLASAFGVFLFRQATLQAVPRELVEAATIDGCGEARAFFAIALPLLRPMVGAFVIVSYLAAWNNFIAPQIVIQDDRLFPLTVAVANLRGSYSDDYGLVMAGTLVAVVPVAVVFLMLQRDFVSGMLSGSVKG